MTEVNYGQAVYGLRELEIAAIVAGVRGAWMPWSGVTLEFGIEVETAEQMANDIVIATITLARRGNFTITAGHADLDVLQAIYGGTPATINPGAADEEQSLTMNVEDDSFPPFAIRGRVIGGKGVGGDGIGGDMVFETVGEAYATGGFSGSFDSGGWWSPGVEGVILPDSSGDLFKVTRRKTAAVLS